MYRKVKSLLKDNDGQALILVVLIFSVLIGFVALAVDYGFLVVQRRNLQNSADAAALAAAWELPNDYEVTHMAVQYAKKNNPDLKNNGINVLIQNNKNEVKVTVEHEYSTFFAKIFGINTEMIAATATAEKVPWYTGLLPFADLSEYTYPQMNDINVFSNFLEMRVGSEVNLWSKAQPGNFGLLDLTDFSTGSKNIKDVLKNGVDVDIVDESLPTEPGKVASIESSKQDLSNIIEKNGGNVYIIAVLPSRVLTINGKEIIAWGDYVVLNLEDFHINYIEKNGKKSIDADKPLSGTLKNVYNISQGEYPGNDINDIKVRLIK